jgi:arylsulfatase A-like enzyme
MTVPKTSERGPDAGQRSLGRGAAGAGITAAAVAAFVGAAGAVSYGTAEALVNTATGLYLPATLWAVVVATYGAIGLLAGGAVGAVSGALGRRGTPVRFLMAGFVGALVFVHMALPLNDRFLPGVLHPLSLVANGLVAAIAGGVAVATYRWLAEAGPAARAASFLMVVFAIGLALATAEYVDTFVVRAGGFAATLGVYTGLVVVAGTVLTGVGRLVRAVPGRAGWPAAATVAGAVGAITVGLGLAARIGSTQASVSTPKGAERPNVLWIVMDTVRPDHLSLYGYPRRTSPHLEALAGDAAVFENATAQAPWTMPSHFQMVTSSFGSGKSKVLDPEFRTAAELFHDAGYRTGAVLANFSLGRGSGFEQGFDTYVDGPVHILYLKAFEKLPVVKALLALPFVPGDLVLRFLHRKRFLEGVAVRAESINEHALRFVDDRPGMPFFLFVNYMDAHDAYDPPRAYRDRFVPIGDPEIGFVRYNRRLGGTISSNEFVRDVVPTLTPEDWRQIVGLYDAELLYLDEQIGRLVEGLRARGLYDRTIIVVTADHGELFGEHGLANHFKSLSEEEIRVPLVVRYPPALRPGRVTTPAQLVDVLPTLRDLVGLSTTQTMDGRSLVPMIDGAQAADPTAEVFSFLVRAPERGFPHTAPGHLVSVRSGSRKFIWSSTGKHAYYDFTSDPTASRNAYGDTAEVTALAGRLAEWRKGVGLDQLEGGGPLDRLTRERLRALGYIQ